MSFLSKFFKSNGILIGIGVFDVFETRDKVDPWTQGYRDVKNIKDSYKSEGHGSKPVVFNFSDGSNQVIGSKVADNLTLGRGNDIAYLGDGDDTAFGDRGISDPIGGGDDEIHGGGGNDKLYGNSGNDDLYGDNGSDLLDGGFGNDKLEGGEGRDELWGKGGADRFIWRSDTDSGVTLHGSRAGIDVVKDFSRIENDKLDLSLMDARVHSKGNNSFTFIGNFYDGWVALKEGEVAAVHIGNDTYIQGWDGDTSGVSFMFKLEGYSAPIQGGDFDL